MQLQGWMHVHPNMPPLRSDTWSDILLVTLGGTGWLWRFKKSGLASRQLWAVILQPSAQLAQHVPMSLANEIHHTAVRLYVKQLLSTNIHTSCIVAVEAHHAARLTRARLWTCYVLIAHIHTSGDMMAPLVHDTLMAH